MSEILDLETALEYVGGEKELLDELLTAFVNDKHFSMEELISLEKKDSIEAAKYVHYFKGAGRQLCANLLNQKGQALEDFLRGKTQDPQADLEKLNKDFLEAYNQAYEEIKKAIS